MDRQTIKKANEIIEKIETMKKEINYLKEYIKKGVTVYFKRETDFLYSFIFSDPLILTVDDVLCLIGIREQSIEKLEEELKKL